MELLQPVMDPTLGTQELTMCLLFLPLSDSKNSTAPSHQELCQGLEWEMNKAWFLPFWSSSLGEEMEKTRNPILTQGTQGRAEVGVAGCLCEVR